MRWDATVPKQRSLLGSEALAWRRLPLEGSSVPAASTALCSSRFEAPRCPRGSAAALGLLPLPCLYAFLHPSPPSSPHLPHSILPLEAAGATIERNIRELMALNYEVGAGWGGCSVSCASTQVAVELFPSVLEPQQRSSLF